jgi:antitoxin (DNA-binding transcriptional repressor) of toxin-antitoxin stability system
MYRRVTTSELRRRPLQIVREAQGSAEGVTITYRGVPVAVLRGWSGTHGPTPELGLELLSEEAGHELGASDDALEIGGGWLTASTEPHAPDTEAVLDSASWGQWEALSETERRALLTAIQQQRGSADGEDSCLGLTGRERQEG